MALADGQLGTDLNPHASGQRRSYVQWFDPAHIEAPSLGPLGQERTPAPLFEEYYKPTVLTQLDKTYA